MKKKGGRIGLLAIVTAIGLIIVLSTLLPAAIGHLVGDRLILLLLLIFTFLVLLLTLPLFLISTKVIRPSHWTQVYVALLSRIFPQTDLNRKTINDLLSLGPITELRMKARDWKQLHHDCQNISLKIVILRGMLEPGDLHGFEIIWGQECSVLISEFCAMQNIVEGPVNDEFKMIETKNQWFQQIESIRQQLMQIMLECSSPDMYLSQCKTVDRCLHSLNLIFEQVLQFIDKRLQHTIHQLDKEIELARTRISGGQPQEG